MQRYHQDCLEKGAVAALAVFTVAAVVSGYLRQRCLGLAKLTVWFMPLQLPRVLFPFSSTPIDISGPLSRRCRIQAYGDKD
jgi:hypothetical protein